MATRRTIRKKRPLKLFVVKKYVWAESARHAVDIEGKQSTDDVWIDEDWKKNQQNQPSAIGFQLESTGDDY